jgi:acyl-ACP thioesterase
MAAGRVFERDIRAGLADSTPAGRVRLDALARWLQDVAFADVDDAGLADRAAWVVRRLELRVRRFPVFGERLALRTTCTGLGRMWAERTTTVAGDAGGDVDALALWVSVDLATGRPQRLPPAVVEVYGSSAAGRRVGARLRHPAPPPAAAVTPWRFRAADLDLLGHVNNAAYWAPLEEELLGVGVTGVDAELEFRGGADDGDAWILRAGERRWFTQPPGVVVASVLMSPAP